MKTILSQLTKLSRFVVILSLALCAGCGSDTTFDISVRTGVVDIRLDNDEVRVGDGIVMGVAFDFSSDDVFDDGNVVVAVELPPEVTYRSGTAEIDGDDGDKSVAPQITNCSDGTSFLIFDMDRYDLENATNLGSADALLKLTVDALDTTTFGVVEAKARPRTVSFSCNSVFDGDDNTSFTIVP